MCECGNIQVIQVNKLAFCGKETRFNRKYISYLWIFFTGTNTACGWFLCLQTQNSKMSIILN